MFWSLSFLGFNWLFWLLFIGWNKCFCVPQKGSLIARSTDKLARIQRRDNHIFHWSFVFTNGFTFYSWCFCIHLNIYIKKNNHIKVFPFSLKHTFQILSVWSFEDVTKFNDEVWSRMKRMTHQFHQFYHSINLKLEKLQ